MYFNNNNNKWNLGVRKKWDLWNYGLNKVVKWKEILEDGYIAGLEN